MTKRGNMIVYNPNLNKNEKEEIISLVESLNTSSNNKFFSYDILLKSILYGLVFYLINSELISLLLTKILPKMIDKILVQSFIFSVIYYIISTQI